MEKNNYRFNQILAQKYKNSKLHNKTIDESRI